MDRAYSPINSLLAEAACIVRRSKKTAGTFEPTEGYKRRQIEELISFANLNDLWIDFNNIPTIYLDKGGENEVFYDGAATIYKLNNFEYAGDDLENFFIRISAHNKFFSNVPYQMIGFAYNSLQEFCAVLSNLTYRQNVKPQKMKLLNTWKRLALKWTLSTNFITKNTKYSMLFQTMYYMG